MSKVTSQGFFFFFDFDFSIVESEIKLLVAQLSIGRKGDSQFSETDERGGSQSGRSPFLGGCIRRHRCTHVSRHLPRRGGQGPFGRDTDTSFQGIVSQPGLRITSLFPADISSCCSPMVIQVPRGWSWPFMHHGSPARCLG